MILNAKFITNFYKYKRKLIFHSSFSSQNRSPLKKNGLKILFFGTDNFSLHSFQAIWNESSSEKANTIGAVTLFKGPPNCVKQFAEQNDIPLYKWPIAPDVCRKYDLGVVVSFGHLIPKDVIKAFPIGMINVHASILPRWRGAAPIIYAIMKGDTKTGVSVMKIEPKKFDIGDILAQKEIEIDRHVLMPELHNHLAKEGASLLLKVISEYPESFQNTIKQNEKEATYAPKITPLITDVNWNEMTSIEIYNLFRALYGYKHLRTYFNGTSLKIVELKLSSMDDISELRLNEPGFIHYDRDQKCFRVICVDKKVVEILKVKADRKPIMSALDFNNGFCKNCSPDVMFFSNK